MFGIVHMFAAYPIFKYLSKKNVSYIYPLLIVCYFWEVHLSNQSPIFMHTFHACIAYFLV